MTMMRVMTTTVTMMAILLSVAGDTDNVDNNGNEEHIRGYGNDNDGDDNHDDWCERC